MLLSVLIEQKQFDPAMKIAQEWMARQQAVATRPSTRSAQPKALLESQRAYVETLLAADRYKPAEEFAGKLVAERPQDVQALRMLYSVLSLEGKQAQAMAVLEKIYLLDSQDDGINNDLGYQWADRGINLGKAEGMIRKALSARPTAVAFKDSLGWVLYKQGRFAEAKGVFDQVVNTDSPDLHAIILDHAGDNCWRLGLNEEALRLWARAVESAKMPQKSDSEIRKVLDNTPRKIDAARQHREVKVAPLGQVALPPVP
jgi:tetratricopeptide (TPR) repeat protein